MAGIDHTCIYFHNGMLMREISHCDWLNTPVSYADSSGNTDFGYNSEPINEVYLLPFETNRDGIFIKDNFGHTYEDLTGQFKYDWFHKNRLIDKFMAKRAHKYLNNNWYYSVEDKYPEQSEHIVRFLRDSDDEFQIILLESKDFNVTWYHHNTDTYIVIGGYGHYNNPYLHFYHRGYGEQFERKLACECYNWLMEDILEEAVDTIYSWYILYDPNYEIADSEAVLKDYQDLFGYKSYWNMTDSERRNRLKTLRYDPDSVFPDSRDIYNLTEDENK